jgi:hypothetical protein
MLLGQSAVAERSWWNGPDDHGGMSPLISGQPINDRAHRGGMPPGGIPPGDHTDRLIILMDRLHLAIAPTSKHALVTSMFPISSKALFLDCTQGS